ncbi:hypothetical protein CHISP_0315 [Chitinispirillum alkaliphilum]|nr:hypothetical protein CHISP_0315 [Chitinispirillum alkaliphilum]
MVLFLTFLLLLGFLSTLLSQSLIEGKLKGFIIPVILFLFPVAAFPLLSRTDMATIRSLGENVAFIQTLSLLMIAEGIIIIWLGMSIIRHHYHETEPKWFSFIFYLPSSSCIIATLVVSFMLMMRIAEVDFFHISLISGLSGFLLLLVVPALLKIVIKQWGARLEIKMLLALIQVLCASFIPIFMHPVAFAGSAAETSIRRIAFFFAVSAFFIISGFIIKSIFIKRKGFLYGSR